MMRVKSIFIFLISANLAFAQDDNKTAFSLEEAQKYAIDHQLNYKNSELEYEEARRRVQEITATGLPQVRASFDYNYFIDIPVSVVAANQFDPTAPPDQLLALEFGQPHNSTATLFASQQIFDGTYIVGIQAAKAFKDLKLQNMAKSQIDVKDAVSRAYYNVLAAEENQIIFTENLKEIEEQLTQLRAMYEAGFIEEIEVDQMELIYSQSKYRKEMIE